MKTDPKFEKFNKMAKVLSEGTLTPKEVKQFIAFLVQNIVNAKQEMSESVATTSREHQRKLHETLQIIGEKHYDLLQEFSKNSKKQDDDFKAKIEEVNRLVDEIRDKVPNDGERGEDGKDADPEEVVPLVLKKIKKQLIPLTGEEIVAKVNALNFDDENNKLDFSILKNVPEFSMTRPNGGGWRNLWQLHDVNVEGVTDGQVLTYQASSQTWIPGTGGGAGSLELQTNGTNNGSQTILNLIAGTNMSIADDGLGNITFSSTGGSQDLQSVTDVGNTTANTIVITDNTLDLADTPTYLGGVVGQLYQDVTNGVFIGMQNQNFAPLSVKQYIGGETIHMDFDLGPTSNANHIEFSNSGMYVNVDNGITGTSSQQILFGSLNPNTYGSSSAGSIVLRTDSGQGQLWLATDNSGTYAQVPISVNGNTADSAGNITISTGSGTVTSVATGTGISGGPITTTGTLTANLSTGIAGGQSAIGGTASGENLTLSSTTNATKGKIIFGSASVYDEVNDRFGIGQTTPTSKLHITRDDIRVTQSDAYGIFLQNSTAATAGITVQYSPAMVFRGSTWLTTAPASSTLDYRMFARPVSGASASSHGGFIIQQSQGGGAYGDTFEVGQTIFNSNDYQLKLGGNTVLAFGGGVTQYYGGSNGFTFYNISGSVALTSMTNAGIWSLTPSSNTATTGTVSSWIQTASFAPTSGTGVFNTHTIAGTINQTGGANGITRGIYINQTITAAADYRSLEIARGNIKLGALDMVLDTTTGTKIGTATSQKLSLWNATPIVQPTTAITAAAFVANTSGTLNDSATYGGYTIGQIVAALQAIGALA